MIQLHLILMFSLLLSGNDQTCMVVAVYMSTLAGCCVNLQTLCDISLAVFNGGVSMVIFVGLSLMR